MLKKIFRTRLSVYVYDFSVDAAANILDIHKYLTMFCQYINTYIYIYIYICIYIGLLSFCTAGILIDHWPQIPKSM